MPITFIFRPAASLDVTYRKPLCNLHPSLDGLRKGRCVRVTLLAQLVNSISCGNIKKRNAKEGIMNQATKSRGTITLTFFGVSLLTVVALLAAPGPSYSRLPQSQSDNTKMNKGDANKDATTADQQKMDPGDRTITQKIRAEIMKDKSLSSYAHNVKIITRDGKVTLKGPVRSPDEKASVEEKAAAIAGDGNVTSQLEIVPPKS